MRFHHVQLSCPPGGEQAARAFWVDAVGLHEVAKPPGLAARGGAWFRAADPGGTVEVHVGVEERFVPARKAHPALAVDDLEAVALRLAGLGYPVRWDDDLPGFRRFYTADPHGNRVEMVAAG
ncbi:MAG: glyoxalase [Nocardioidaceae bacterium]|nr:glyoxalase [Nocardioidaceae bacterium]